MKGWRGLTPLALNPLWFQSFSGLDRMDPAEMASVHWTHSEDLKNVYGVDPDGYARNTYDNVGVQYGLKALKDGNITPAEFLNAERPGRQLEGGERHGPGGLPVPVAPPPMPPARRVRPVERGATCGSAPTAAPRRRRGARAT